MIDQKRSLNGNWLVPFAEDSAPQFKRDLRIQQILGDTNTQMRAPSLYPQTEGSLQIRRDWNAYLPDRVPELTELLGLPRSQK